LGLCISQNERDKTVAMILFKRNIYILTKYGYYVMVSISPESYDEGLYTQIFSQFYVIFSLSYKLINPSSENIATVLSPTVCASD